MTYIEAALKVLKTAGEAMSADEITDIAIKENMIKPDGKTPVATMGATLYTDMQKNGDNSQFIQTAPGRFACRGPSGKKTQGKSTKSIVYVVTNPAMDGYVKVGITDNLDARVRGLDQTNTPLPFELYYAAEVKDAEKVERHISTAFSDKRVRKNREFYEIDPEQAVAVVELAALRQITLRDKLDTEDNKALEKANEKAERFSFKMVDIPPGSTLYFKDDDSITCEVVNNRHVRYENEEMPLSTAARLARGETGRGRQGVRGSLYWKYEGETLQERRERIENE